MTRVADTPARTETCHGCAGVGRALLAAIALLAATGIGFAQTAGPTPLLKDGSPVAWWFVYKFNAASFRGCGSASNDDADSAVRACPFGGRVKSYPSFSQQFVFASSKNGTLQKGSGCVGTTDLDPLGATFGEIYNGSYYYLIWNDQFYQHPKLKACSGDSCGAPWGHSKGMLAWDESGQGLVLQVTTPSWPAAGSDKNQRKGDGNTLGCVANNNVKFAQHFFALRLNKGDLLKVLAGLREAGVVTDPTNSQIVRSGGPDDVQQAVDALGNRPQKTKPDSVETPFLKDQLSSNVILIAKPAWLHVPPWQMVSAALGGVGLRTATWWAAPKIYSTKLRKPTCWDDRLGTPGPVAIATTGHWGDTEFQMVGSANHAKIGVSTSGDVHYSIFGDMNQQGAAFGSKCGSSQNGRGGIFFVLSDEKLFKSVSDLVDGDTAPQRAPQ